MYMSRLISCGQEISGHTEKELVRQNCFSSRKIRLRWEATRAPWRCHTFPAFAGINSGRHLYPVPSFIKYAGGSNAINPPAPKVLVRDKATVSTNFSGVDLVFIKFRLAMEFDELGRSRRNVSRGTSEKKKRK